MRSSEKRRGHGKTPQVTLDHFSPTYLIVTVSSLVSLLIPSVTYLSLSTSDSLFHLFGLKFTHGVWGSLRYPCLMPDQFDAFF